ncbi:MAG: ABC transporter permease [Flavobacteriales bacterium CG_4_9_14_3_um_filter_32_8]|nr:MAG: ABC transporter permease [Flavobacteriales bacterium CG_4_9_14_3_um_filter_32_8]
MIRFITKRILYGFLVLAGVVTVVFLLFNVLPGDPARMLMGQRADAESLRIIKKDLGLDRPLSQQFVMYINDLSIISVHDKNPDDYLYLDEEKYDYSKIFEYGESSVVVFKTPYLRRSYSTKRKVSETLADYMLETTILALASILLAAFIGILFGIISALKKDTWIDRFLLFLSILGMSVPSFFSAILISYFFGYVLSDITGLNMTGSLVEYDDFGNDTVRLYNLILPALTLGIRPVSAIMQLTRSSMLDVLSQDYIRTASAKGLRFWKVIIKHALKNALNPVITAISGMFASLLAGALFVEWIFGWKGIGWVLFDALTKFDLPIVMGGVLLTATIFVVINIIVDITYGLLDPRVRVQ